MSGLLKSQCSIANRAEGQPAKIGVSPRSSSLGTFHEEERLLLSDRTSILMG